MPHNKIILINTPNLPCPGSHYFGMSKFLKCFRYFEYEYQEITSSNQYKDIQDEKNIIYLSNHGLGQGPESEDIVELSKLKNSIFLLWHWHGSPQCNNFKKWILTGEHWRNQQRNLEEKGRYDAQNIQNYVPLIFAAPIHPDEVKPNNNPKIYDCFYCGCDYRTDWLNKIAVKFPSSYIHLAPFIAEEERVKAFGSSLISLGFQHETNKKNLCITERIFEGFMYGCLVVVDCQKIQETFPKAIIYTQTYNDLMNKITYFKKNPTEIKPYIAAGYDYLKNGNTYYHTCLKFIQKIKELNY
jgi:hypothetical protein